MSDQLALPPPEKIQEELSNLSPRVNENGTVVVQFHDTWMGVTSLQVLEKLKNYSIYVDFNSSADVRRTHENKYVLVSRGEVFVSVSKSSLLERRRERADAFAYIGVVGVDPNDPSNFTCLTVLTLGDAHKPEDFNAF